MITTKTGKRCYKILLWKAYFDKGFGLTNYLKYVLLLFGWATNDAKTTIIIAITWACSCLLIGRLWYYYRIIDIENEVSNAFNPFAVEVRRAVKKKRFK